MTSTIPVLTVQTYGAKPGYMAIVPSPVFVDTGEDPPIDPFAAAATYPIQIGRNSYELYLRFQFVDPTAAVGTLKIHTTASLPSGVAVKYKGIWTASAYTTPTIDTSTVATTAITTALPAASNLSINNSISNTSSTTFFSDYLVLQVQTTTAAVAQTLSLPIVVTFDMTTTQNVTVPLTVVIGNDSSVTGYIDIDGICTDTIDLTGIVYPDNINVPW
jgi:hypothetical protein